MRSGNMSGPAHEEEFCFTVALSKKLTVCNVKYVHTYAFVLVP
jgi:hypothetical protein